MSRFYMRFGVGAFVGLAIAVAMNLLPYWQSYEAYGGDGLEVIGFPFTFRSYGGMSPTYTFRGDLLAADVAVGIAVALAAGYAIALLPRLGRSRRRGFPVMPPLRGGGGSAAE